MMYDRDEALDAALFALPLEAPPSGLRASILAATVYRPAPVFGLWELAGFGTLAAVIVWSLVSIALGGGSLFVDTASFIVTKIAAWLPSVTTLAWLAAGTATAFWLFYFTEWQPQAAIAQVHDDAGRPPV